MQEYRDGDRRFGLVRRNGQWVPEQAAPAMPMGIQTKPADPRIPAEIQRGQIGVQRDSVGLTKDTRSLEEQALDIQAKRSAPAKEAFDRDEKLRKEFLGRPEVQTYGTILPQFGAAVKAGDNGAGDLQLIYAFGKIMDPGSVVREGELEMAQTTGSMGEQLKGLFRSVSQGGRLTPEIRQQLLSEVRTRGSTAADAYNLTREDYKKRAQQYGADPDLVLGTHPGLPFQQAEADFLGRPVRNLDGSQGAAPVRYRQPGQPDPQGLPVNVTDDGDYDMDGKPDAATLAKQREQISGKPGVLDVIGQGMTLGLSDEAAGVGNMFANAITSPFTDATFDPGAAYQAGKGSELARVEEAKRGLGGYGTALEIGSGLLSGNVGGAFKSAPTLLGRMGQGARAGAAGGGVAGFGFGEGAENSMLSAGGGAVLGASLGAGIPLIGQVAGNRVDGLRRLMGRDPELSRRLVSEAIQADGNTPRAVGQMMDGARGRGAPLMLADTGDNTRALLASVGRQPGPGRTIARDAVTTRQNAQADRITGAISRDLGPIANPYQVSDELIETAKKNAAPLYHQAYWADGAPAFAQKMAPYLKRPSMRSALARATRIAQEEGRDPTALGLVADDAGGLTLGRGLSWRTMDYIKRGMDDVVESYRDPTTGKLNLDTEGRAINNTLRVFLKQADLANPAYAAARNAFGGPASAKEAMQKGLRALNKGGDDIAAQTKGMTDYQLEFYRLGVRRAMADLVSGKTDGSNKVLALLGTPKKRQALERLFGGRGEYQRFVATLGDEQAAQTTYQSVTGGSQTAERMAADATTNDTGLAETAVDAALRGAGDTLWSGVINGLTKLRDVDRFGAGQAGERTRESVAALLSETDPTMLRELMVAARRAAAKQRVKSGQRSRNAVRVGRNVGDMSGYLSGQIAEPR